MIKFIKQLFCKHEYVDKLKVEMFYNINGETVVTICEKCEKVKETKFYTHEQMTFKYK